MWTAHTLKLNTLSPDEAVATFERFCPPFALNRRRGSRDRDRAGKGPLPDFKRAIGQIAASGSEPEASLEALRALLGTMEDEAVAYEAPGGRQLPSPPCSTSCPPGVCRTASS